MENKIFPLQILVGGIIVLATAIGIGRFAYTPILPIMQDFFRLSDSFVGYLASVNFLGYLIGALIASALKWEKGIVYHLKIHLFINILSTIAMGLTDNYLWWFILRGVSGVTSGLVFVFITSLVIDFLAKYKKLQWTGFLFSGVGLGIALSSLLVPLFDYYFQWQMIWIGLGVICLLLAVVPFAWMKEPPRESMEMEERIDFSNTKKKSHPAFRWIIASYTCVGVGYIVSGTFMVAMVQEVPSLSGFPSLSWLLVGIGALPATLISGYVAEVKGYGITLQGLFVMQIVGITLPLLLPNAFGALVGSLLFGASFMGLTAMFVAATRALLPEQSNKGIGFLTFVFGIGQMVGPIIAGILIEYSGNYNSSIAFATIILLLGMVLLAIANYKLKNRNTSNSA
ncbi:YbfB/YjiJ family MFS transporter [Planococcus salinus]|uniref:YbfB/YjiJ family MFS transporter n=1 Tax=Planococcus salinus TaxID=1848460 RepID=A0A3M8P952_9BACL|nr:YbfB/YjiJ family MFS transporter [Planococcus salinus]RNF39790.1 YbfB/YjiJ family MFS transporter [Planococcus salinus]